MLEEIQQVAGSCGNPIHSWSSNGLVFVVASSKLLVVFSGNLTKMMRNRCSQRLVNLYKNPICLFFFFPYLFTVLCTLILAFVFNKQTCVNSVYTLRPISIQCIVQSFVKIVSIHCVFIIMSNGLIHLHTPFILGITDVQSCSGFTLAKNSSACTNFLLHLPCVSYF